MTGTEERSKFEELVAKEVYLHFTENYNRKNWVHNYPAWSNLSEDDQAFWLTLVKLSVYKTRSRKGAPVEEAA